MTKYLLLILLVFVIAAGYLAYDVHRYVNNPVSQVDENIDVTIQRGATFTAISEQLKQASLISKPLYFKLLAKIEEKTQLVKTGEYSFNTQSTPSEILDDLVKGNTKQYKLTVVEGKRFSEEHSQMLRDYLDEEWPNRSEDSFVKTPYEALILASIVEKETSAPEERARIAGVFISRLKINMPLQTDPTVIYGIGDQFDGNLTRKHLQADTPYNTYMRRGLPPSPICLMGKESIRAVLHPQITGELYFVSKKDGTHNFSRTYEEHANAVRKYQLGQ